MLYALFDGEHPPKILVSLNIMTSVFQDAAERDAAKEKVEQKMEVQDTHISELSVLFFVQAKPSILLYLQVCSQFQVRKMKKELKKDLGVDKCKQQ